MARSGRAKLPEFFLELNLLLGRLAFLEVEDLGEVTGLPGTDRFITFRKANLLAGETLVFFFSSNKDRKLSRI
jgi:hypothetical protein